MPTSYDRANQRIRELNERIALLAASLDRERSPVRVADQFAGFDASQDTCDGVHPNAQGESTMSTRWQEALVDYLAERATAAAPAR